MHSKNLRTVVLVFIFNFWFQSFIAQEDYATIRKNINVNAKDLMHDLCQTKDTLILKSNTKIDYVYTINRHSKREMDTYVRDNSLKIPLNKFTKGRQVFVVEQNKMNIVFVVHINDNLSEMALIANEKGIVSDN